MPRSQGPSLTAAGCSYFHVSTADDLSTVREALRRGGTVVLPTRPRRPEHKGKVESSVKYVKNNALKGRIFESVADENLFLLRWEGHIADRRIHLRPPSIVGSVIGTYIGPRAVGCVVQEADIR